MNRRHLVAPLLALTLLSAAACGAEEEQAAPAPVEDKIEVSGDFAAKPTITIDAPIELEESTAWTATEGDGEVVAETSQAILQLTLADGTSGKTAISTTDEGQRPLHVQQLTQIFPSLVEGIVGEKAGSRVVVASTAADAYGDAGAPQVGIGSGDPVVMVADILSTTPTSLEDGATGAEIPAPATAPRLQGPADAPTGFDLAGLKKPRKLVVVPLREGTGPVVANPDLITVNYLGQVWGADKPFESSFTGEPATFPVGLAGVIGAWDQGLVGLKEGARVLLVCPPDLAYGDTERPGIPAGSTLVFVVDVLGVG